MSAAEHSGRRYFGDYEILAELGRGGVGEAYAARATTGPLQGQDVCLKIMGRQYQSPRDDDYDVRHAIIGALRHEAQVVGRLQHPNIAQLLDSGAYNDVWFLVFELVEGANLWEVLAPQRAVGLPPLHTLHIGMQVSAALAHAHSLDVLHRDIKPGNILVRNDGVVKLVDFGLAKVGAADASRFTQHIGTPRYWAPEQIEGAALGPTVDIFALGLVLFECVTGAHPFFDEDPESFRDNVLQGRFTFDLRARGVPDDLASIIQTCLEVRPVHRFASGLALHQAILEASHDLGDPREVGALAEASGARRPQHLLGGYDSEGEGDCSATDEIPTRVADIHRRPTRPATSAELAAMTADALPGATASEQRVTIMEDLSRMARDAMARLQNAEPSSNERPTRHMRPMRGARTDTVPTGPAGARGGAGDAGSSSGAPAAASTPMSGPVPDPVSSERGRGWVTAALVLLAAATGYGLVMWFGTAGQAASPSAAVADATDSGRALAAPHSADGAPAPTAAQPTLPERAESTLQVEPTLQAKPTLQAEPTPLAAPPAQPPPTPRTKAPAQPEPAPRAGPAPAAARARPAAATTRARADRVDRADRTDRADRDDHDEHDGAGERVEVTIGLIPGGEVFVDGRRVGSAPVTVRLRPGPHRIAGRSAQRRLTERVVIPDHAHNVILDLRHAHTP